MKTNHATRVASLGLAAVVACLAVFSIVAAYVARTQADRVLRSESLAGSYEGALAAIAAEQIAELNYLFDLSPEHLRERDLAGNALTEAIADIAALGGREDEALAKDILALHDRFFIVSERMAGVVASGDIGTARLIHEYSVDTIFQAMTARLESAAEIRRAESQSALAALQSTSQWVLILAPVVFAIGFVLLLAVSRTLEQYDRARSKAFREIEKLSKLRGEFVSIVSHEFRTPLTGIQGFSEVMRDEELTIPEMREYAGDINKDARRLARLISDMLDLDRMESGLMTVSVVPVDLNRVVADAAAQFRLSAARHPIELDLDQRLPTLIADPDRIAQVVTNLLSNAIKYSPSGGAVELRTTSDGRSVTLTVRDHGIGIPTEQLEKIFERYARIATAETQSIQGTGLGLPIVRQIVQLYEGKVWATSQPGAGSVLHVQFPLPADSVQRAVPPPPRVRAA